MSVNEVTKPGRKWLTRSRNHFIKSFLCSCFSLKFLSQQMSFLLTFCLDSDAGCNKPLDYFVFIYFTSLGLSAGVEVGKPTHFTIYTKGAGKAKPEVHFTGAAKGEAVRDFEIIDNHDYSYTVRYTAVQQVR